MTSTEFVRVVLGVLLPPFGTFLQKGFGRHFWINVLLTLFGYIPGLVHVVWMRTRR